MQPPFVIGMDTPEDPHKRQKQAWEYRLAGGLLEIWRKHQGMVLEWLKKQKDVKKQIKAVGTDLSRDKKLWAEMEQDYKQLMLPVFEGAMEEAVLLAVEGLPFAIGADWELVNAQAAAWARKYTYGLINGIDKTTRKRLQASINNWIEAGETFPDLVKRVQKVYSNPVRAELIASTEITRVYAEANTRTWEASGVVEAREWQTAADERVCPICGPLQGKQAKLGKPFPGGLDNPPAHPRCRCWVVPVVMEA